MTAQWPDQCEAGSCNRRPTCSVRGDAGEVALCELHFGVWIGKGDDGDSYRYAFRDHSDDLKKILTDAWDKHKSSK